MASGDVGVKLSEWAGEVWRQGSWELDYWGEGVGIRSLGFEAQQVSHSPQERDLYGFFPGVPCFLRESLQSLTSCSQKI